MIESFLQKHAELASLLGKMECPHCHKMISLSELVCPYCDEDLDVPCNC